MQSKSTKILTLLIFCHVCKLPGASWIRQSGVLICQNCDSFTTTFSVKAAQLPNMSLLHQYRDSVNKHFGSLYPNHNQCASLRDSCQTSAPQSDEVASSLPLADTNAAGAACQVYASYYLLALRLNSAGISPFYLCGFEEKWVQQWEKYMTQTLFQSEYTSRQVPNNMALMWSLEVLL